MTTRTPNFMIAGEQKAGTSYLQTNLRSHPQIFMTKIKEPLFFHRKDYDPRDVPQYLSKHFSEAGDQRWVGEASTVYFQHDLALQRVKDAFGPRLKFIICLRHPTEKLISLYLHSYRRGRLKGNEKLLGRNWLRAKDLKYSLHAEACARIRNLFNPRNVHFIEFSTLLSDPSAFVESAYSFLDLEPHAAPLDKVVNGGNELVWDGEVLTIKEPAAFDGQVTPKFTIKELRTVHRAMQEDIDRTAEIIGMDLTRWKKFPYGPKASTKATASKDKMLTGSTASS